MKKVVLCVGVLLVLVSFLFAAGQEETGKTHLLFHDASGNRADTLVALMDEFLKDHPDVTYELNVMEGFAMIDTTPSMVAAEQYFDVSSAWAGPGTWGHDFFTEKYCYNLTPYYEKYGWEDKLHEGYKNYKTVNKWFHVPNWFTFEAYNMYNKRIFKEAGIGEVSTPVSLEEMNDIIDKLVSEDYTPWICPLQNYWKVSTVFNQTLSRLISAEKYNEWLNYSDPSKYAGNVKFTNESVVQVFNILQDWTDRNFFGPPSLPGLDHGTANKMFGTGKAAMCAPSIWEYDDILANEPDFEIGIFQWPQIKKEYSPTVGAYYNGGYFVPRYVKKEHLNIIAEWFDFMLSEEGQIIVHKATGNYPVIKMDINKLNLKPLPAQLLEEVYTFGGNDQMAAFVDAELRDAYCLLVNQVVDKKFSGNLTQELEKIDKLGRKLREAKK